MTATYYVPAGNWTNNVTNSLGDGEINSLFFPVSVDPTGDPAVGCPKDFTANYGCGIDTALKSVTVSREANGKEAKFDCAAEATRCNNLKLTLTDDGKLTLATLDGATVLWDSVSNGGNPTMPTTILPFNHQFQLPDDNNKPLTVPDFAGDGKVNSAVDVGSGGGPGRRYIYNYLLAGQMLEMGQWIGSPSGTCRLMMGTAESPNSLQVVMSILGCNTLDADDTDTVPDTNCARVYSIPQIHNEHIGKVGYVNNNGQLQMYPDTTMTSYGSEYEQIAPDTPANSGYNISGAFLGAPFKAESAEACQTRCSTGNDDSFIDTQRCAGVIFDTRTATTNNCQLLDKTMYRQNRIIDNNYQYYIRQKGVTGQDVSCPSEINIKNAAFWNELDLSANMTESTKCGLANFVETERKNVAAELPSVYNNLEYTDKTTGEVLNLDYSEANADPRVAKTGFKLWYDRLHSKFTLLKDQIFNTNTAIDANFNELQASKKNLADWTGEQLQNLEAMNEDRDLNMMSQNYRHIMWSILAIVVVIGIIMFTKSMDGGKSSGSSSGSSSSSSGSSSSSSGPSSSGSS